MIDWLSKELVSVYSYDNIDEDRKCTKSVRINGRLYDKHGEDCATTAIALVYKVFDPSINHNKYAVVIGVARQNPYDNVINKEIGQEIAMENALMNPVLQTEFPEKVNENIIYCLMRSYVIGLPVQQIKTHQEILAEGKNIQDYERNITIKDKYYEDYYKEFRNIFID